MCQTIYYREQHRMRKIAFREDHAKIPVQLKKGGIIWLPWGRHQQELGQLPMGGWAPLDAILAGKWDEFMPKPIKIPIEGFDEEDIAGQPHYFKLVDGQFIQGLLGRVDKELRAYIVTIQPTRRESIFGRWPKIVV